MSHELESKLRLLYLRQLTTIGGPSFTTYHDRGDLWVRFPVGAGSSHTKNFKNGSGPCLHGTHDKVGTTKHDSTGRPFSPFLTAKIGHFGLERSG